MKTIVQTTVFILLSVFLLSCNKNDDEPVVPATLTGFTPTSGPKTTVVTINGTGFGIGLNNDRVKVFFNDKQAEIQAITDTQITAIVPPRAFTGKVKVVVEGVELLGDTFTYLITDIQVSTLAGSTFGFADGTGTNAQFAAPKGVAVDAQGTVYVADSFNNKIRKISPSGEVTTLAGSTTFGFADGTGANAQFKEPNGIAVDAQGNVYVSDINNHKIRKITQE